MQKYTHTGYEQNMIEISSPLELLTNKDDLWFKAADVEQRDKELHLMAEQIAALAVEGDEIDTIAQRLLAMLKGEL